MFNLLQGYRTYILGSIAIIVIILGWFGIIDTATVMNILPLLGFGSAMAIRSAIAEK